MRDAIRKCGPHPKWMFVNSRMYYGDTRKGACLWDHRGRLVFSCWDGPGYLVDKTEVSELQAVVLATQDPEETIRRYAERKGGGA